MKVDFYNPRSIVCFVAILQGLIFAGMLLLRYSRGKQKADFWLAALLLVLCSALITPLIGFANVYDLNQWLTYFPFSIAYSYGVCVWFYTLNLTDSNRRFRFTDWLLFVPTIVYVSFRLYLFAHDLEWKGWFGKNYGGMMSAIVFVTEFVWNFTLLYLSIRHYKKYRTWLNDNFSDTERVKFDWLRNFLYFFAAVLAIGAFFDFADSFVFKLSYIQFFYFELILALSTYYLAVAGYLRSKTIELNFAGDEVEERKTALEERDLELLKSRVTQQMSGAKLYLEPGLTLNDLARKLGVNTTVLSFTINNGFGKNFNDFVNEFRIEDVKQMLLSGKAENENLLAIAFDCGFNSKATFNRAFKKFTGLSPKEFLESNLKSE